MGQFFSVDAVDRRGAPPTGGGTFTFTLVGVTPLPKTRETSVESGLSSFDGVHSRRLRCRGTSG